MVRCQNPARAGPFGGCVPVQMAGGTGNATNTAADATDTAVGNTAGNSASNSAGTVTVTAAASGATKSQLANSAKFRRVVAVQNHNIDDDDEYDEELDE